MDPNHLLIQHDILAEQLPVVMVVAEKPSAETEFFSDLLQIIR